MKVIDFFKKSDKNESELDHALGAIVRLEKELGSLKEARDAKRQKLREKIAEAVGSGGGTTGQDKLHSSVLEIQAKMDTVFQLIREAKIEANALITAGARGRNEKIAELETKIREIQIPIDRRKAQAWGEFAHANNLVIEYPTRHNGGRI